MSAAATRGGAPAAANGAGANPWLIAVLVALASFMEVLDTTIANVALNYIAGGLGVSEDEASWVVTTYLVANAIIVMATSFLARKFGRKAFFLACLGVFTLSSVLCGMASSLQSLLLFRILQGFAGGGMVPVAQSILADSFPPAKRGQAFALFGVAVVVAPVVGPTLGGWLADNYSWHWSLSDQRPGRPDRDGVDRAGPARAQAPAVAAPRPGVRFRRLRAGGDLSRRLGDRARSRAR